MAIRETRVKSSAPKVAKLRAVVTSTEGRTLTTVETWVGPYADLKTKQNSLLNSKQTHLEPTEAGQGVLKVTTEKKLPENNFNFADKETYTEVIWLELRKKVETHPFFADLEKTDIKRIRDAAQADPPLPVPTEGEPALKLYNLFLEGTTDYIIGVPMVRETTTKVKGNQKAGKAWVRQKPPIDVPGDWEWMLTSDQRVRDGEGYTQTKEWTAAEKWDEVLYPDSE